MTPEQLDVYSRLKTIPRHFDPAARSTEVMQRQFEDQARAQSEARARLQAAMEPTHQALRSAFSAVPGITEALRLVRRPEAVASPQIAPAAVPAHPMIRLGSTHIVDVKPFYGIDFVNYTGNCNVEVTANGNTGYMWFNCAPGWDDSGHARCWCAIGQGFVPPFGGVLRFSFSPSFNWHCMWLSNWWREAAGKIFIGQVINRWNLGGTYIDTPVSTQIDLYSYDDYNFSDGGDQLGSSIGYNLSSEIVLDASVILACWVWIGCSSNADGSNAQSMASNFMSATVPSITIDYWPD